MSSNAGIVFDHEGPSIRERPYRPHLRPALVAALRGDGDGDGRAKSVPDSDPREIRGYSIDFARLPGYEVIERRSADFLVTVGPELVLQVPR